MSNTVGTYIVLGVFISIFFFTLSVSSNDILNSNPNLNAKSIELISNINQESNRINPQTSFNNDQTLTQNATFTDADPFEREFLESKSETQGLLSIINNALNVPGMFFRSLGINETNNINIIIGVIVTLLSLLIGLAVYKGWRSGQVD